jgi:hypothetical protein
VLVGLALLGAAGGGRAESISALDSPDATGLVVVPGLMDNGNAPQAGASRAAPADPSTPDKRVTEDDPRDQSPLPPLLVPSTQARDSGGMGGNPTATDSGHSSQQLGLASSLPLPDVALSGRLFLLYVYCLPCPFPSSVFHPPRSA